jgi:SAM-dependent methyltransferase
MISDSALNLSAAVPQLPTDRPVGQGAIITLASLKRPPNLQNAAISTFIADYPPGASGYASSQADLRLCIGACAGRYDPGLCLARRRRNFTGRDRHGLSPLLPMTLRPRMEARAIRRGRSSFSLQVDPMTELAKPSEARGPIPGKRKVLITRGFAGLRQVMAEDVLDAECRRLGCRPVFLRHADKDSLRAAGVERGMRVLDLGCGFGDTSLLIAKAVGASGLVVGVDPSAEAIEVAEKRVTAASQCYWTRFLVAELLTFVLEEVFDVVIARPTSLNWREPAAALRRLPAFVHPGGIIAFLEASCRTDP